MTELSREQLDKWEIQDLRNLRRELKWALEAKENKTKVCVYQIEEYTGVTKAYLSFDLALQYVLDNIEKAYRDAQKEYVEAGYTSYGTPLSGHAPKIVPQMYLPDDLEEEGRYFILDLEANIV